jgi:hypothetical protein
MDRASERKRLSRQNQIEEERLADLERRNVARNNRTDKERLADLERRIQSVIVKQYLYTAQGIVMDIVYLKDLPPPDNLTHCIVIYFPIIVGLNFLTMSVEEIGFHWEFKFILINLSSIKDPDLHCV